ncbi:MAG: DUF4957 domain-containing protein [Prevotella sp.]|nr:DUF4957 domain-containing protein [Prevotella sp.]
MKKKLFLLKLALVAIAAFAVQTTLRAAEQVTSTYTFTNKSWNATLNEEAANWISGKDGAGFMNNGVQVTNNASYSGANATSPEEFNNITKIVVTYNTNKAAGAGTLVVKIGDNAATTKDWAYSDAASDGRTANFTAEFDYATPQSGAVTLTANTTTNSIYVVSVAITHDQSAATTVEKPAFSLEPGSYVGTQSVEISCATEGAAIYYTTDGTTPTAESTAYTGAVSVIETATIKAIAINGEDKSQVATAAYTILESIANTEATALTIEEAVALIDSKDAAVLAHEDNQVYIKGVVSKVDGMNAIYKSITYWISADGTETGQQFEIYGGLNVNGTTFDNISDIQVGQNVIVKGNLKKFGDDVYEMDKNNELVRYGSLQDIIVEPDEGDDISLAVNAVSAGKFVKDIYVYLAPGKNFTISAPIVAPAAFVVMGAAYGTDPSTIDETATPAVVDASALTGPFVQMSTDPAVDADANGFYPLADVGFLNVKVTGLKQQLFYANKVKYLMNCFHLDFCNIHVAGGNKTIIDTNGGGVIGTLDMSKNTIWAEPANTGALYSSQSGQKATEAGLAVQTFNIERNTFYNIAYSRNTCSHRQNSQTWLTYNVRNNVFVNTGKSGQAIKGLNGGGSSSNPTWNVDGNAFNFDGADTSAAESTGDDAEPVQNSVAGVFAFTDAATGDFNGIFKGKTAEAPAKYPGDPRWAYTYEIAPTDIVINAEDITDGNISAAFAAKTESVAKIGNVSINLDGATNYTISASIVAPASFTLNGNGATIDASALDAAMITTPTGDLAEWMEGNFTVKDVTVKGLTKAFYASAGKNYLYNDFLIQNCVIELAGTAGNDFDFRKGGVAKNFTIDQSTIYAPAATTNSLYTSQSAQRGTEAPGVTMQTFSITNSTLYNIAKAKNFFTHRQANQTWLAYTIKNSVFLNVGKSGQVVKGINQGQSGANPTWDIEGNVFNFDGADTSAAESTGDEAEPVTGSIAGIVTFTDAANGDFTPTLLLAPSSTSAPESIGDPRWIPLTLVGSYSITVDENIENGTVTADAPYAAVGTEIKVTVTPAADYELETLYYEIEGDNGIYEITDGKFDMPNGNVTIKAAFKSTATGINSINADAAADNDAPAYNLAGQKVGKGYKGVVIKNGRKVVIK